MALLRADQARAEQKWRQLAEESLGIRTTLGISHRTSQTGKTPGESMQMSEVKGQTVRKGRETTETNNSNRCLNYHLLQQMWSWSSDRWGSECSLMIVVTLLLAASGFSFFFSASTYIKKLTHIFVKTIATVAAKQPTAGRQMAACKLDTSHLRPECNLTKTVSFIIVELNCDSIAW